MSKANYQPAGFEDDFDDDDDMYFGDEELPGPPIAPGPPINRNNTPTNGRGGFGVPPPHPVLANGFKTGAHRDTQLSTEPGKRRVTARPNLNGDAANHAIPPVNREVILDDFKKAVLSNQVDYVSQCLDMGIPEISANTIFPSKWSALMYAAHGASVETTQLLLEKGADSNYQADMFSVLMACCSSRKNNPELLTCAMKLIETGADINGFDRQHMSVLMYAAKQGHWEIVRHLTELSVNLDKQDNRGWTALMWATQANQRRVVDELLQAGASVEKMTTDGRRVLDIAAGRTEIETLLRQYGASEPKSRILVGRRDAASDTEHVTYSTYMNGGPGPGDKSNRPPPNGEGDDNTCTVFGELEMFLSGISLGELIPVFQSHQIQFTDLLRLKDKDLMELGITQWGVKKKILDAVLATHRTEWQSSSIPNLQYNRTIQCSEAIAILANINKHAKFIGSTIGFVSDQVQEDISILKDAPEGAPVEDLVLNTEESIVNVKNLYEELVMFRRHLNEVSRYNDFTPPDLIVPVPKPISRSWRRLFTLLGLVTVGVVVWKADEVMEIGTSITSRLTSK